MAGLSWAGPGRAEPSRAETSRAGPNRAEPSRYHPAAVVNRAFRLRETPLWIEKSLLVYTKHLVCKMVLELLRPLDPLEPEFVDGQLVPQDPGPGLEHLHRFRG